MTTELQLVDAAQLRAEVGSIQKQLTALSGRLAAVEERLTSMTVPPPPEQPKEPKKRGRPGGVANNGRSLEDFIIEVLQNSNEPLSAKEVAELVLDAGYRTASKRNFVNIVLQALVRSPSIRRFTRGKTRPTRYVLIEAE